MSVEGSGPSSIPCKQKKIIFPAKQKDFGGNQTCKSLCKQSAVESDKKCVGQQLQKKFEHLSNKNVRKIPTPKRKRNDVSTSLYDEVLLVIIFN